MTRAELVDLYTNAYDSFMQIAAEAVDVKHPKVADVIIDPTKDYKYNAISSMGAWEAVDEDSSTGLDHFVLGYEGTITPGKFRKYFYVTYEANFQVEYAQLKSKIFQAKELGRGGQFTLELEVAHYLYNGFSTACADGQYLFYNSHPKNPEETGTTYDNLLSGAFSHDALEEAEKTISANFLDLDGMPMAPYAGKPTLAYPSALRGPVMRVLSERAGERPGTTVRDINIYSGEYDPVEWVFLGSKFNGSDTAWYIIYPALKNLKLVKNTEKPNFASWIDELNQRYYFDAWQFAQAEAVDWRGLFASTGTV